MRSKLHLLILFLSVCCTASYAQLVGTNIFFPGHFLEIGQIGNGAFGACAGTIPTGYYQHCVGCAYGNGLAMVYDYGHDGWTVGAPPEMGDYTFPGTPFEGWEIQVNGAQNQAFQEYGDCPGSFPGSGTLTGSNISYSSTGGRILGNWQGTASSGGLAIYQETRVDTDASWVVVTTRMYNTTSSVIPAVYYLRSCDPDNDQTWSGGGFATTNTIVYQNDTDNRVLVTAYGATGTYTMMGLGTKDCRAVCFIYNDWPLSGTTDLGTLWSKTYGPADYTVSTEDNGDIGIGLVYKLGDFPANDSAVISYSYIFGPGSATTEIDSALPDPELEIDGVVVPNNDSFFVPIGVDTVYLDMLYATDKDWTWSKWTWSPGIGLSATTGTDIYLYVPDLTGPVTYTVTGTNTGVGMEDCGYKQFVFTIIPPHMVHANSPCIGDTLKLSYIGNDTLGATYLWTGPGGFVSTQRNPYIFPSSFADTGIYTLIKTYGGIVDTYTVHVTIHALPVLDVSSNIPLCGPLLDSLELSVGPDSLGETFSWSGPNGFTSTLEFPMIMPFDSTGAGTYFVSAISEYGCHNTGSINVYPGIDPGFTFVRHYGCNFDTVYFTNTTSNANLYSWNFGDGTPTDPNRNTYHVYASNSLFYVSLTCHNDHCDTTITIPVDLRHSVKALFSPAPDTICYGQSTTFLDSSYSYLGYGFRTLYSNVWNFGDGPSDATFSPTHTYPTPGVYPVTLVATDSIGCEDSLTKNVYVLELYLSSFSDTTLCVSAPMPMTNVLTVVPAITLSYIFQWSPGSNLSDSTVQIPNYSGLGLTTYTLTASVNPYGCPVEDTMRIFSVLGKVLANVTPTTTITLGSSIQLNADSEVIYWWKPNDGSLDNPNINDPIATPSLSTLYTVYGYDANGCLDSAYVDIIVDSTMDEGLPGGFTPNGDGLNDVFKPIGEKYQRLTEFRIYNRWGQQVFYSNSFNSGWDGTFNGVPQEMGVYFYSITVARPGGDGSNIVYKGEVTLIR